jgi:glutamate N-acetyltransferase / amino-acid N-acetyltransferase
VRITRDTSDCAHLRAVVVNAGNANAFTGEAGLEDARRMRAAHGAALRLPAEQVAVASTGVIGAPLEMDKVEPGIAEAAASLKPGGGEHFSQAIRRPTPRRSGAPSSSSSRAGRCDSGRPPRAAA